MKLLCRVNSFSTSQFLMAGGWGLSVFLSEAGRPPLVCCPRLLTLYVCTYFQHLKAVTFIRNLSTQHTAVKTDNFRVHLKCALFSYKLKLQLSLILTLFFNEYVRHASYPTYGCWMYIPVQIICFRDFLFELKLMRFASCLCFIPKLRVFYGVWNEYSAVLPINQVSILRCRLKLRASTCLKKSGAGYYEIPHENLFRLYYRRSDFVSKTSANKLQE
jgi:hypothetical protein